MKVGGVCRTVVQCTVEVMEPCDWLETERNLRQRCAQGRHFSFVSTELVLAGNLEFLMKWKLLTLMILVRRMSLRRISNLIYLNFWMIIYSSGLVAHVESWWPTAPETTCSSREARAGCS